MVTALPPRADHIRSSPLLRRLALSLLAVAATGVAVPPAQAEEKAIKIGWTAWEDCEAVTAVAKNVLENRLGYKVELVLADIGLQYQALAKGDVDVILMTWLPTTHKAYMDKVGGKVEMVGVLYEGAKLGWVVPAYVPVGELGSIEDLKKPAVVEKLGGKIQGIDPGAGLMQASEKAIGSYGLPYELVSASDAAMTAALERATKRKDWLVATGWSPHVMFSKMDLRYLDDPKGALGGAEQVSATARQGFKADHQAAQAFLANLKLPIGDVEKLMAAAKAPDGSYDKAAADYLAANPAMVDAWLKG